MQVSSMTNNYQTLNNLQGPVILPIPQEPKYSSEDVYKASDGNLIVGKDGELALTPQGELNVKNSLEEKANEVTEAAQAQKDATRAFATDYLAASSKKSQAEIYLAVATDGKYDSDDSTADVIRSLRDVQKQNNAVQAYATYKETQENLSPYLR